MTPVSRRAAFGLIAAAAVAPLLPALPPPPWVLGVDPSIFIITGKAFLPVILGFCVGVLTGSENERRRQRRRRSENRDEQ